MRYRVLPHTINKTIMEKSDALRPEEQVTVTIYGPEGENLYQATSSGYRSIEEAINEAVTNAGLEINPKLCVFEVSNLETGVSHRYRLNAHGNLKLIV